VKLLGAIGHAEIPGLLAQSSALCLPSHGEPFGMAALEAMAAGRPVVAFAEGGPSYLVDHGRGGYLVAARDAGALASALLRVLSDPDGAREMGRYNRRKVEAEFSRDRTLSQLEAVYTDAVEDARGR
jgi:alpha-maltose-1-phosphate synthase